MGEDLAEPEDLALGLFEMFSLRSAFISGLEAPLTDFGKRLDELVFGAVEVAKFFDEDVLQAHVVVNLLLGWMRMRNARAAAV